MAVDASANAASSRARGGCGVDQPGPARRPAQQLQVDEQARHLLALAGQLGRVALELGQRFFGRIEAQAAEHGLVLRRRQVGPGRERGGRAHRVEPHHVQAGRPGGQQRIDRFGPLFQHLGAHDQHVHDVARHLAAVEDAAKAGSPDRPVDRCVADRRGHAVAQQGGHVLGRLHLHHGHVGAREAGLLQQALQHQRAHRGFFHRDALAAQFLQRRDARCGQHHVGAGRGVEQRDDAHVEAAVDQPEGFVQGQRGRVEQAVAQVAQGFRAGNQLHHLELARIGQSPVARQHQRVIPHPGVHAHRQRRLDRLTAGHQTQGQAQREQPARQARAATPGPGGVPPAGLPARS
jgi:hypothetical protein